nr:hypothetical protein [Tanacetum cinerariifolium]
MDDHNITMEEYTRLEEEKARRRAIVFNDSLTSEVALTYKPTVSPLSDNKINFRISFDESDDEDYMDAIRHILGFGIQRIDLLYRPCYKEDDMVYSEKDVC